jgi:glyoxylase-like metal-dependent hydrolase (beta-lactamase superfamily II)
MASYDKGLVDLGNGVYAYLQPDGGWGWSNAGLIRDGEAALLVDTLFDEPLTGEMLAAMRDATGLGADEIGTVVNTHANGDHTHGNGLLPGAEIVASAASAREMEAFAPAMLAQLKAAGAAGQLGVAGRYFAEIFAPFDFAGVAGRSPTRTFEGRLDLKVGDKGVRLIEVGPAHTAGDVIVHVPTDRTVFTGDILFIDGTPIMWDGPVGNWLAACDAILEMDVDHIVPGHGPLADRAGVRAVRDYLEYITQEARKRYDAGLSAADAAFDIGLGRFDGWRDAERLAVNVDTLYRQFAHDHSPRNTIALFELMGRLYYDRKGAAAN